MQAYPNTVDEIFSGQAQYVIPVFQRTYEWQLERWKSLWDDLNAVADEHDPNVAHFIGPIVLLQLSTKLSQPAQYLVIDGQQRLMTLSVLVAALRDQAFHLNLTDMVRAIEGSAAFYFYGTRGEKIYRVVPRIRDRETFYGILNSEKGHGDAATSLLHQAYEYFFEELGRLIPDQPNLLNGFGSPQEVLERIYQAVNRRLRVVEIRLGPGDDPSNIYESLNFKQAKLQDAALIRNYVFMRIGGLEEQESFNTAYWQPFEEHFSFSQTPEEDLNDFYYRFLISQTRYFARRRLYVSFVAFIDEFLENRTPSELASELSRYAEYFLAIVHKCEDQELETAFSRFRMLEAQTATPLVLSLYDRYYRPGRGPISKQTFLRMLRTIESFILRRSIMQWRTRGYGEDFAEAREHSESQMSLERYFNEKRWPTDEEIKRALKDFSFYTRETKKCRLVLTEIERSYGHKEKVDLSDRNVEIEHVMPQNLTQNWHDMLGQNAEVTHEELLHTLGNLTLTGYNLLLGDKPYLEKRAEYVKSNFSLNSHFADHTKWTRDEILGRTETLAERFVDLWGRPVTSGMLAQQKHPSPKPGKLPNNSAAQDPLIEI